MVPSIYIQTVLAKSSIINAFLALKIRKPYNSQYKLIHFYQDEYWELFDLEKDPNEMNNVYEKPEYANIVLDMKKELKRLQQLYGDTDFDK